MTQIRIAANGPTSLKPVPTRANLTLLAAVWNAFWWREIDFYPRIATESKIATMETSAVIAEMYSATERWAQLDGQTIDEAIKLARQPLDEVKGQNKYQDQKATRLLTVTTFLNALSGLLFTRFQDNYPIGTLSTLSLEGLTTIYVPSRFRPRWEPDEEAVAASFSVERFDQAVEMVLQECSRSGVGPWELSQPPN